VAFLIFALFIPFYSFSSEPVIINDDIQNFELTHLHYEILKDSSRNLTIKEVASPSLNGKFHVSSREYNYVEDVESAYWIRFKIKDISVEKRKWVLEFYSIQTEDFQFYVPQPDGTYKQMQVGQLFPFGKRDYKVTNFVFDLPHFLSDDRYFYVRILSNHASGFEFFINSQQSFTSYTVNEYYFLGIYYGILLIMAVYNLLLYFTSREKVYLLYVLYVLSCMINSFTEDGLGFQYIWGNFPSLNWPMNNYLWSAFFLLTFVHYSTTFLDLKKHSQKLYKIVLGVTVFYFALFVTERIFIINVDYLSMFYILPFLVVYIAALYVYKNGFKPARFFILGYTFVFIGLVILQLRNYGIMPHNIFTVYSFNYGIVLEVVVLSFALGDRIKIMKAEKENAQRILIHQLEENQLLQQKVNKELEEKVNQRTKDLVNKTNELSEANEKLQKMTEELNKFASKLDYDNWELNKKVIEEKKARMTSKELSYEEFSKIFPNDFSCLKYVEEMKWGEGYQCKKCQNTKFTVKAKLLARKCSRCNYIESVTSSTIFHSLKFPIQKAFFITYITSVKQDKIAVDHLSEILQLNRLTCYKFRKKVLAKETEMIRKEKSGRIDNWEVLITE
ncbi:MAG: transposase, partial [Cytophagaceae bacterium]|nr:transposase [Cytophagaceae bacterium]